MAALRNGAWTALLLGTLLPRIAAPASPAPTGDIQCSYLFVAIGQQMPYRLYVPDSYDGQHSYPLIVVLHGGGADYNSPLDHAPLRTLAEARGFIVLSPMGYNRFGGYGDIYPVVVTKGTAAAGANFAELSRAAGPGHPSAPGAPPQAHPPGSAAAPDDYAEQPAGTLADPRIGELSEQETLAALADVERHYRIDPDRVYLMGNSAGGVGTLYLAAKYPQLWAALSPQAGVIAAWSYPFDRLREYHLAALFVHGELDAHANFKWSQAMVDQARTAGADARLLVVPRGTHEGAWEQALPQILDFFQARVRSAPSTRASPSQ